METLTCLCLRQQLGALPDCLHSLLISLHIKISRVQEEHFVFGWGWLLRVIQAPPAVTVHIAAVNIHGYICISPQTGRF